MAFFRRIFRTDRQYRPSPPGTQEGSDHAEAAKEKIHPDSVEIPAADAPPAKDVIEATEPRAGDHAVQEASADAWWATSTATLDTADPVGQSFAEPEASHPAESPLAAADRAPAQPTALAAPGISPASEQEAAMDDSAPETEQTNAAPFQHPIQAAATPAEEGTHELSPHSAPPLSQQRSAQGLAAAALRDIGRIRENNQDSVFALLATLPREGIDLPMGLFVVADGMGGHDSGEIASRLAIRSVVHEVLSQLIMPALDDEMTEALQPLMVSAIQEANRTIWEHARLIGSDMGTTCTAALLLGHALYIAHVGDTRVYLLEPAGLRAITTDHSAVGRLIQLGQLDPAEAREHPLRSQLYRTIGQHSEVQVDFIYQPIGESTHVVLCSDGLWGMVAEEQIEQALSRSPWPQDVCQELIALANLAGGEDNISAIVVTLPIPERPSA